MLTETLSTVLMAWVRWNNVFINTFPTVNLICSHSHAIKWSRRARTERKRSGPRGFLFVSFICLSFIFLYFIFPFFFSLSFPFFFHFFSFLSLHCFRRFCVFFCVSSRAELPAIRNEFLNRRQLRDPQTYQISFCKSFTDLMPEEGAIPGLLLAECYPEQIRNRSLLIIMSKD